MQFIHAVQQRNPACPPVQSDSYRSFVTPGTEKTSRTGRNYWYGFPSLNVLPCTQYAKNRVRGPRLDDTAHYAHRCSTVFGSGWTTSVSWR